MDTIGLTLRSKSRRARPQISSPKPISGPLPPQGKGGPGGRQAVPKLSKDRAARTASNATTSDLVKRRYSSRFNQPEVESAAPPVPQLPQLHAKKEYGGGGLAPPRGGQAQGQTTQKESGQIPVDLNALGDPSLPAERC